MGSTIRFDLKPGRVALTAKMHLPHNAFDRKQFFLRRVLGADKENSFGSQGENKHISRHRQQRKLLKMTCTKLHDGRR